MAGDITVTIRLKTDLAVAFIEEAKRSPVLLSALSDEGSVFDLFETHKTHDGDCVVLEILPSWAAICLLDGSDVDQRKYLPHA